jgi:hypothetical protein
MRASDWNTSIRRRSEVTAFCWLSVSTKPRACMARGHPLMAFSIYYRYKCNIARDNAAARVSSVRPAIDIFSINAVSTLGRSNFTSTLACFSFGRSTTCRQNRTIYFIRPFKPFRFLRSSHALAAGPGTSPPSLKCRALATALNFGRPYGGRRTGE